ncbi:MAG: thioredoxin-dependent thiol peroxidase [Breznakibacter sp.]
MKELKEGDLAPAFSGINQHGKQIRLSDFKGKKVILYFYPKDNTPGCTAEACNFNDNYSALTNNGFEVVGVSPDSQTSHQKFMDKFGLKFNLIADAEKKILEAYNAYGEKNMYGKTVMGVLRTTYVIDENGLIVKIIKKVDTKASTAQVLKELNMQ